MLKSYGRINYLFCSYDIHIEALESKECCGPQLIFKSFSKYIKIDICAILM